MSTQEILRTLGIGQRFKGHALIVAALNRISTDECSLYSASSNLFKPIAAAIPCDVRTIERNIRTAVDHAWRTNPEYLIFLAGYPMSQSPTVLEFLDILNTYMLREQSGKGIS